MKSNFLVRLYIYIMVVVQNIMTSKLILFPVILCVLLLGTITSVYLTALALTHVEINIPAVISVAAAYFPESRLFAQLMNFVILMMICVIYIRYLQVVELGYRHEALLRLEKLNWVSLNVGLVSILGLSIVANFDIFACFIIHGIGAVVCYTGGTIYFAMQTVLTYNVQPFFGSMVIAQARAVISGVSIVLFVTMLICGTYSNLVFDGPDPISPKWDTDTAGYPFHVAAVLSEWIITFLFAFYMLSFAKEFSQTIIHHPKLNFTSDDIT